MENVSSDICGFDPRRDRQHSFVEIDHEIFFTVILSLPLIQEGQLSVCGERMCTILVNCCQDKTCPVNVWLGNWPRSTWHHWVDWAVKPQHKQNKHMQTAKAQIRLHGRMRVCTYWSRPSLTTYRIIWHYRMHQLRANARARLRMCRVNINLCIFLHVRRHLFVWRDPIVTTVCQMSFSVVVTELSVFYKESVFFCVCFFFFFFFFFLGGGGGMGGWGG